MSLIRKGVLTAAIALCAQPAIATAMKPRPFAVGGGEGAGAYDGWTGFLLAAQAKLTHAMALDLRAVPHDPSAFWALTGIGFLYGVAHAAGPGHGKAVIASYMMATDSALRRGVILAFFAALLQGLAAVALVGIAAALLNATAARRSRNAAICMRPTREASTPAFPGARRSRRWRRPGPAPARARC